MKDPKEFLDKNFYYSQTDEGKKALLEMWRLDRNISIRKVCDALGIHEHQYYVELDRLGVPYEKRARKTRQKLASPKKPQSSCVISFSGEADPRQLEDIIERLSFQINEGAFLYAYSIKLEEISE